MSDDGTFNTAGRKKEKVAIRSPVMRMFSRENPTSSFVCPGRKKTLTPFLSSPSEKQSSAFIAWLPM